VKTRNNPELYARLCVPRPRADVEAALAAFDEELYALREKHGIPDLMIAYGIPIADEHEAKVEVRTGYYGNSALALQLAAANLSIWRQVEQAKINETVESAMGTKPKRAKKGPTK
jgi:hypothetical protein